MSTIDVNHTIRTYETASLSNKEIADVVEKIKPLFLWFSPESTEEDMRKRLLQHPHAQVDLLFNGRADQCEGFSVYYTDTVQSMPVIFRGGTVISKRSQGHYKRMLGHSMDACEADFVITRTQNPRVYETLRSFSPEGVAYPSADETPPPEVVRDLARHFCKGPEFNPETMVLMSVYEPLRKDADFKTTKDPRVAEFFARSLGENDAFFVVIPLKRIWF